MSIGYSMLADLDPAETQEWREATQDVLKLNGSHRVGQLLSAALDHANANGAQLPPLTQTPYVNTIAPHDEPSLPGDLAMEQRVGDIIRWNAVMMVVRANKSFSGIGGHLSSYASSAHLYEVGFNHFFHGPQTPDHGGDLLFYQGHATPGIYARAFLEGRLSETQLLHFRRELGGQGLSSYPHPWLMPDFWQFPTVSMGLGPLHAIYQARFNRYLHHRGLKDTSQQRVWAFLGDGECDEPETLGALTVAAREGLSHLRFVVNCNLQRLDGPVRGNGKIIQELESVFRGAGWHVIKVIWGPEWDPLFANDTQGLLLSRLGSLVDGEFQKFTVASGDVIRREIFGHDPRLLKLVEHLSDTELTQLSRGGHSDSKLYAAYDAAEKIDGPVCILAKTVKGWGLGPAFEASNVTHQLKKLEITQIQALRDRLHIPFNDQQLIDMPFYHPGIQSPEIAYMIERRRALGGFLPQRLQRQKGQLTAKDEAFAEFYEGSKAQVQVSTTMAFVRMLRNLLRDEHIGRYIVPIVPDEARTFGMDAFFREFGIYAPHGQTYTPIDATMILNYHESQQGQMLEEGITEAGSMASFMAAGTAGSTHGVPMVPFYMFYSMFGLQRTGDQVWACGDARTRGFLLGATAGRTTLHGEGLQHDDGHSHLLAQVVPNLLAYDPAYAYESAVIVRDGLRRMLHDNEDIFYYITLYNENYLMPPMPKEASVRQGILKGLYLLKPALKAKHRATILASGPLVNIALQAQQFLAEHFDVGAAIYSATSYQQLFRQARQVERHNRLHPETKPQVPYITEQLGQTPGPVVAVSDWIQELPSLLARFVPQPYLVLGTNGFGRSDTREALRQHFEIDMPHIVVTVLYGLLQQGQISGKEVARALKKLDIDPSKLDPMLC